jgi:hypothetical protein
MKRRKRGKKGERKKKEEKRRREKGEGVEVGIGRGPGKSHVLKLLDSGECGGVCIGCRRGRSRGGRPGIPWHSD